MRKGWKYCKLGPFLQRSGFSEEFYNYVFTKYGGEEGEGGGDMRQMRHMTDGDWDQGSTEQHVERPSLLCVSISNDAELHNISHFPLTHSCLRLRCDLAPMS